MHNPRWWLVFLAVWLLLLIHNSTQFALWEQDEAAYAGFAMNMVSGKSWLIPDFIWSEQHRKTPFHFWSIALCYKLFGFSEWATRIPTVLSGLGLMAWMLFVRKKLFSEISVWTIPALIGSNLLLSVFVSISFTDATLLLFNTIAIFSYILYVKEKKRKYLFLLNLAVGFSLLTKGPPIVLIMGSMMGLHFLFWKEKLLILKTLLFLIPSLLPLSIWILWCWQEGYQDFLKWLLDWYILKRTSGTVFGQTGPFGYYTVLFLISFLFWLPWIGTSFRIWKSNISNKNQSILLLLCSLPGSWLLYEVLPSKLPSYSLAALPVLVLFLSNGIEKETSDFKKKYSYFLTLVGLLFIGLAFIDFKLPLPATQKAIQVLCVLMGILSWISAVIIVQKNQIKASILSATLGFALLIAAWTTVVPTLENQRAAVTKQMSSVTSQKYGNKQLIFSKAFELPGMGVYLQKNNIPYRASSPNDTFSNNNVYLWDNENLERMDKTKGEIQDSLKGWISDRGVFTTLYWVIPKK